jgi:hypothetical protein
LLDQARLRRKDSSDNIPEFAEPEVEVEFSPAFQQWRENSGSHNEEATDVEKLNQNLPSVPPMTLNTSDARKNNNWEVKPLVVKPLATKPLVESVDEDHTSDRVGEVGEVGAVGEVRKVGNVGAVGEVGGVDGVGEVGQGREDQLEVDNFTPKSRKNSWQEFISELQALGTGHGAPRVGKVRKISNPEARFSQWDMRPEAELRGESLKAARGTAFSLDSKMESAFRRNRASWMSVRHSIDPLEGEHQTDQSDDFRDDLGTFYEELETDRAEFLRASMEVITQIMREEFRMIQENNENKIREIVRDEFKKARDEYMQEFLRAERPRSEATEQSRMDAVMQQKEGSAEHSETDMVEQPRMKEFEQPKTEQAQQPRMYQAGHRKSEVVEPPKARKSTKKRGMFFSRQKD